MTNKSLNRIDIDVEAYEEADVSFRLAQERFAPGRVQDLAREVVRRLAFRLPDLDHANALPDATEIDRFCEALLSSSEAAADEIILSTQRDGVPVENVYLGYIAGASRRLGDMWNNDEVSFTQVGLGTGRLYRIIRGLRHTIGPAILEGRERTPALFALPPGETHTLGIEMAADLFRRGGGTADVCLGQTHDAILELADKRHYSVIVLAANSDRVVAPMLQLAVALRISQPLTPFALAGNLVEQMPEIKQMVGAEMVFTNIKTALPELLRLTRSDN